MKILDPNMVFATDELSYRIDNPCAMAYTTTGTSTRTDWIEEKLVAEKIAKENKYTSSWIYPHDEIEKMFKENKRRNNMGNWYLTNIDVEFGICSEPRATFEIIYYGPDIDYAKQRLKDWFDQDNFCNGKVPDDKPKRLWRHYIKKVIFNNPATIIIWRNGDKTVVKAGEGEEYDPEKGFAMAIAKYALGNQGNYYETFKKWLPEEKEETITKSFNDIINDVKDDLNSMFNQFMNPPEEEK